MKKEYEDYIVMNIRDDLNSMSDWVESFCDEFNLKVKWSGMMQTNATFTRTLKSLEQKGLITYAFKCKIDRGWGQKGGCIIHYMYTTSGYEYRDNLLLERTTNNSKTI